MPPGVPHVRWPGPFGSSCFFLGRESRDPWIVFFVTEKTCPKGSLGSMVVSWFP